MAEDTAQLPADIRSPYERDNGAPSLGITERTTEDQTVKYQGLSALLAGRFLNYKQGRQPQELRFLENYQDYMRIPRSGDTKGIGMASSKKAQSLFVGATRSKIRTARAKIKDILFGSGRAIPFGAEPTNPEFTEEVETVVKILRQQCEDGDFVDAVVTDISQNCIYGTGHVGFPFVRKRTLRTTVRNPMTMGIEERVFEYPEPYFVAPLTLDVYPDPNASDVNTGEGVFWLSLHSPAVVRRWRDDPRYFNIDEALKGETTQRTGYGHDLALAARGNMATNTAGRIRILRYFGCVETARLPEDFIRGNNIDTSNPYTEIHAYLAGESGVLIRLEKAPYDDQRPLFRSVYEKVDGEYFGVGVADDNAASQKIVNAAFRLFIVGKGLVLNPPFSVDKSKYKARENFAFYPGKMFDFKDGLTPEERKSAMILHEFPDVTDGWQTVIAMAEKFSDDDTGVSKYTQGTDATHLNRTATGISMIMTASNLPLKEVLGNMDTMIIEPAIEALIRWDLEFLEPSVVQELHGEKAAEVWARIKMYGKTGFMRWKATGASTFIAKEVLLTKLMGMLQVVGSSPVFQPYVDYHRFLEMLWDASDTGQMSPILTKEQVAEVLNKSPMLAQGNGNQVTASAPQLMEDQFANMMGETGRDLSQPQ